SVRACASRPVAPGRQERIADLDRAALVAAVVEQDAAAGRRQLAGDGRADPAARAGHQGQSRHRVISPGRGPWYTVSAPSTKTSAPRWTLQAKLPIWFSPQVRRASIVSRAPTWKLSTALTRQRA